MRRYASRYSIGQRLALGFGFLFGLQLMVLAGVLIWQQESNKAYDELLTRTLPRVALAGEVEQAVYHVAVTARDQLLQPSLVHARSFEEAAKRARTLLGYLGSVPADTERGLRYARVQPVMERYIGQAEALVGKRIERALDELGALRESTLAAIRDFVGQEYAARDAALDAMAQNRQRVSRLLTALAAASALLFLLVGWLTARAIRRPAQRLLEFAGALEAGRWKSALALAPPSPEASRHTRDEMQRLGYAFGAAAVALESREQQLQAQNEELQAQNEEIQLQNEEIQVQSEEIHAQNADLLAQTEQLRESTRALKEADEKKNEFLGVLAHELRNPLAPMSNSLALLKRARTAEEAAQAHAILERQLRHLVRLIDDLLDITRISRGKIHLRREPLELVALVRHCAADLRASLQRKGLSLELALPERPIWIAGDDTRLSQVVGNVVGNAIKFTDPGGRIAVRVSNDDRAREACVRIADNGRGMSPALLARLFTPFSQDDSELARSSGGLGLGLALVKGLVELHGGRVAAHSEGPGRGSEVTVWLPLAEAPRREERASPAAAGGAAPPRRILIVEDNPDAAESLRLLLESDGHEVRTEASGPPALETAGRFRPDVVLCDIGLPGMDGYEVARSLSRNPALGRPLLIALTGYGAEADRHRASAAGFDAHFAKPPDLARLNRLLAAL